MRAEGRLSYGEAMSSHPRALPPASDALPEIARRASAGRLAVFLDYDGTLTPIVERPELAFLAPSMRDTLRRLAARAYVAVVSGRLAEDVAALVDIGGITVAGSHGFEVLHADARRETFSAGDETVAALTDAAQTLAAQLADVPGAQVEAKRFALAVHVRRTPAALHARVEAAVRRMADETPGLRVSGGKRVYELRPDVDWHKGAVIAHLGAAQGIPPSRTIVLGDDLTDEDAFAAVRDEGFGVVVGERAEAATHARYALRDVDEVQAWLTQLARLLADQPPASLTR